MSIETRFNELCTEVRKAGELARTFFSATSTANQQKSDGSVVTQVDIDIQARLLTHIQTHFPDDSVIGEEDGEDIIGTSDYTWWIDPIDGTDNFLRRIPFFGISVARLGATAEDSFGIVYNPVTDQLFAAYMDDDVYENDNLHQITSDTLGGRAIISVSRGKAPWMQTADYNLRKALAVQFGKGSVYGCCALELAYVAANRIDGIIVMGLKPWDYAAGLYLVRAAGGRISYFEDTTWHEWTDSIQALCKADKMFIFASHDGLHDDALALIQDPQKWAD